MREKKCFQEMNPAGIKPLFVHGCFEKLKMPRCAASKNSGSANKLPLKSPVL
jgi:hypothetical protein